MDLHENDLEFEKTLEESKTLLDGKSRVADENYEFTLEGILEEFGSENAAQAADVPPVTMPLPDLPTEDEPEPDDADSAIKDIVPALDTPQSYSLQQVLERTVQNVLDEQKSEPVLDDPPPRRGLFSRKKRVETEELYTKVVSGEQVEATEKALRQSKSEEDYVPQDPPEPEPPIEETVTEYREAAQSATRVARVSVFFTILMWIPQILSHFGWMPAVYSEEPQLHTLPFLITLALICILGRDVFVYAAEKIAGFKFTYELLTSLLCLAALADTALVLLVPARAASAALPLHSVAALAMACALRGRAMLFKALYDSFRVAAIGDTPYLVTITAGGAAKRKGSIDGFSVTAQRDDISGRWQTIILPVILVGSIVFSVLSTLQIGSWAMLAWNLSAILAGANTLAFPLVYPLPLRRVTKRFSKSGSALAGYRGAAVMSRSNCLILTDSDLFPPGTVTLSGLKIFGEESGKVFSYAATMAHASETGISRLFDNLLAQEGGKLETLSDLNFYEDGGVGGTIHGETVLFGTETFFRRMNITLPGALKLQTGMFLAVDGVLIAIFAVKYMAAENVDWAMHALGRAHITPVLAVRDGNITPQLLKRKFDTDARAVFPRLSTRLALSARDGENPCALIYREGLMPYAELAVGSKRLCRAVRLGNILSIIASASGTMLAFYLSFVAAYALFTPISLALFHVLWALAALIDGMFVDKY